MIVVRNTSISKKRTLEAARGQPSKIECIVRIDVNKQQRKVHSSFCCVFLPSVRSGRHIIEYEKGVRCSKVKLGTSAILCEIINALICQKKHRR